MADRSRPRISDLRRLAREALGRGLEIVETPYGRLWFCAAKTDSRTVAVEDDDRWEARRQLRELLTLIIAGKRASMPPRVSQDSVRVLGAMTNELKSLTRQLASMRQRHGLDAGDGAAHARGAEPAKARAGKRSRSCRT